MGSRKSGIFDKIEGGGQVGKEAIQEGERLEGEGNEVKSLLDSIDTSMDEDDVSALQDAEGGYSSDFQTAFQEEVETRAEQMREVETESIDESGEERDKVEDAADKFREMASVTDVGRGNAEGGADHMNQSAAEYEDYIAQANKIIEDTDSQVQALDDSISGIFG